ncbi:phenylalanine-4-hydroxylase [Lingula anatina]|uniref:Phenylalanine-4-hydroxylase n=1 Tax=Lingula anatina TaxID=7574 RepID=A0A1S3HUS1_LINAN|nr:phenylalanine-4-hydroxylase-like [Lingula anatina]XP_013389792.1 phenylalanine-4-hydroxylase [Lingula anatina]|eukprot:XP_013382489.1 phenylalanine-4-hydroxylase-like [Lingula anatina]
MSISVDPETAKRRLAFQKSYSIEHGGSWRRKSLIDDAKFETITNAEFEKQEQKLTLNGSISEDDVFIPNGDAHNILHDDLAPRSSSVMLSLKEEMTALPKILKTFENFKVNIRHIESRNSRKIEAQFEIFLQCDSTREAITSLMKALRQNSAICEATVSGDTKKESVAWVPMHISDLDYCNHLITKFEPELDSDHPGYTDKEYRKRREEIANIAFEYRHGDPIPRIKYTETEIQTWGTVYRKLVSLFNTHACKEHIEVFRNLEKEGGFSSNSIPQLEDVSQFLKRKSGFQLRPVAGLLSARDFLASLAFRVFQCTQYIRHGSAPMHSPEPDCIHELLGHVPLLANPSFAQFSQEIGLASLGTSDEDIEKFATLYWFTVEFGLCREDGQIKAYGAGLLSSFGELMHALSDKPEQRAFDPQTAAVQEYQDVEYQPIYYVAESFDDMKEKVRRYASKIRRRCELRYDPYTQGIQCLDSKGAVTDLTMFIKAELNHLNNALEKMGSV